MSLHTLMFGWEFPPKHSGGLGIACEGLVRGLRKHGVRVTLVLPSPVTGTEEELDILHPTEEHLKTMLVPSLLDPYDNLLSYEARMQRWRTSQSMDELYGPDLGSAVERYTALAVEMTRHVQPDVVHCHDWMTYEAGIVAAKHHDAPVVAHVHATELDRTDFHPNEWIANKERAHLLQCDRIIAVSRYTKSMLTAHYGIPADRIDVVHNGHDQPRAQIAPTLLSQHGHHKRPLVLFLGRMTVQKNPYQFLEVAARVHSHRPDVQFVMAGDGPLLTDLIDKTCGMGLQDCMVFTGKLSRKEVQSLHLEADCFVMPSLSEPFGLVALEAIAHGTPVIVSRQSGVAEVLDHAFKVDAWDAGLMSDCILTILREQPLADQLKAEAPRVLQRLTWQNQAGLVQSIYHNAIRS
jgi:glycogen synthase